MLAIENSKRNLFAYHAKDSSDITFKPSTNSQELLTLVDNEPGDHRGVINFGSDGATYCATYLPDDLGWLVEILAHQTYLTEVLKFELAHFYIVGTSSQLKNVLDLIERER